MAQLACAITVIATTSTAIPVHDNRTACAPAPFHSPVTAPSTFAMMITTDMNMPRLDGIGLIREARRLLRFTPILALTTESQQLKRDEAKQSGATGWLVKPVGGAELVKVIKQVLPGS